MSGFIRKTCCGVNAFTCENAGDRWSWCFQKLRTMFAYDVDWNDEGGLPPRREAVAKAISIAKFLRNNQIATPIGCHATDEGHIAALSQPN